MARPTLRQNSARMQSVRSQQSTPSSDDDDVRSAIISAACHAHMTSDHQDAPRFLTPMPLNRIVEVLRAHNDSFARGITAAWLLDNREREEQLRPYAAALVGADNLQFDFGDLPGSITFYDVSDSTVSEARRTRFGHACDRLFKNLACEPRNHRLVASLDGQSLVTNVVAEVDVDGATRPPSVYRKHSDPRGWERNASLFFETSRICRLAGGDFETTPNPSEIGDRNYNELLLEHVSMGFAPGFPIDSINVLNVGCGSQQPEPNFHVTLHASLEVLLGLSFSRGGLDVDGGEFSVEAVDPATHLRGTKQARFTERQVFGFPVGREMNLFAPFCLAVLMSVLIFGGACYDPQ